MKDNYEVVIRLENFKKNYGSFTAVNNINLEVKKGDFFGFIGPNGAGKSTTINCILNFLFPTEGKITILGLDSVKDSVEIKKRVGFVPSDVFYYDNLKIKDLLQYSNSFYGKIDKSLMKKYVKLFDIPMNKKFGELSSGNKKKVAIVQSLLHNPELLILDEPSSGLDPLMQARLFEVLKELRQNGTTIFMSSHILGEVQKYCNKVAFIKDGEIITNGGMDDILDKDLKIVKIISSDINEIKKQLKVKDIQQVVTEDKTISFMYKGDINDLIKLLTDYKIDDLSIHTPDLDDLFLNQYKEVK
ncbi:MAG: ABC transporter ATP-binding protein [Bacilli bacterium]